MAKQSEYVRYTIRVPGPLYARLQEAAGEKSVNAEIVTRLESTFDDDRDAQIAALNANLIILEKQVAYEQTLVASLRHDYAEARQRAVDASTAAREAAQSAIEAKVADAAFVRGIQIGTVEAILSEEDPLKALYETRERLSRPMSRLHELFVEGDPKE